ncbi:hypothetical protein [Conchiformibius kuhniae]|uniref:Uncharacterized protein n=1 Tax=Conchiformibius kuhniae TaxID=211502 RepID=A0ABD8B7J1_9NEIS|nr:hypothetical protein [Conchiformibius kuhniae]
MKTTKLPRKLQAILDKVNVPLPNRPEGDENEFIRNHIIRRWQAQTKLKMPLHQKLYFAEQSMLSANSDYKSKPVYSLTKQKAV